MNVHFRSLVPSDMLTVRQHMQYEPMESTRGLVAYDMDTAETLALFMMDSWTKTSAQVHQVILKTMVLRHGWFEEIARYMFALAGRKKVYATVPANKPKIVSLNEKIGFEQVARLSDAWDEGVDCLILEMTRENCKYWVPDKLRLVS